MRLNCYSDGTAHLIPFSPEYSTAGGSIAILTATNKILAHVDIDAMPCILRYPNSIHAELVTFSFLLAFLLEGDYVKGNDLVFYYDCKPAIGSVFTTKDPEGSTMYVLLVNAARMLLECVRSNANSITPVWITGDAMKRSVINH